RAFIWHFQHVALLALFVVHSANAIEGRYNGGRYSNSANACKSAKNPSGRWCLFDVAISLIIFVLALVAIVTVLISCCCCRKNPPQHGDARKSFDSDDEFEFGTIVPPRNADQSLV
ncbi:hypothetical protein PENTCL1PPCAC_15918, partial [Pristionchus entomophagus]